MSNQPETTAPREWKDDDVVGIVYRNPECTQKMEFHFVGLLPEFKTQFEQGQALLRGQAERDYTPEPDYKAMWENAVKTLKSVKLGLQTLDEKRDRIMSINPAYQVIPVWGTLIAEIDTALETAGPTEGSGK